MGRRESHNSISNFSSQNANYNFPTTANGEFLDENPIHISFCRECLVYLKFNFPDLLKMKASHNIKNENLDFFSQLSHKERGNIDDTTYLLHEMFGRIFFDADKKLDL